ncbi:MAG: methyltransferase domain-containing protein [Deltaproteobacteria bacterium]|nr:methyltransferase domain-containing protein [Deltaproteobacteria bacterium]
MQGFWNRLKAEWYSKGLKYSTLPRTAVPFILSKAAGARTFLDAGAGCGTLAIPLAKKGKKVTALDPSRSMLAVLDGEIKKQGLKNIKTILAAWGQAEVKPHDVVICANVPQLLKGNEPFLRDADALSKKAVFLIEGADPNADKFYYKDLYPLVFNKSFSQRTDYLETVKLLHSMGIFANVEIIEYDFDQPFADVDEAVHFWKEHMGIVTEEHDARLKGYLRKRLVKKGNVLFAPFHKKAAIIWWVKKGVEPLQGAAKRRIRK